MLSDTKIIALYCIVDDLLKVNGHLEDRRTRVSDSEVITTAFVSVLYFGGHWDNARHFMQLKGYIPRMLDKSRFCRRLHRLSESLTNLFFQLGQHLKDVAGAAEYVLDAFPVAVCENMRAASCQLLTERCFWGRHTALRRFFYGVKVQVLTLWGVPVEFCVVAGRENDTRALWRLPLAVRPGSHIYADAGYTDYRVEDWLREVDGIDLRVQRKQGSRRSDTPWMAFLKERMRKGIETTFSHLTAHMLHHLHAVTREGFLLKVSLMVIAYSFDQLT